MRVVELVTVSALAAAVTAVIAAPVLQAPSQRVFGNAIVGRHHDPFTTMETFRRPIGIAVYSQPLTDIPGAVLARVSGPVASYNWIVLLSFPLSAVAAYLLARALALSPGPATLAAMAYAFSPFHLTQAAYHPHVAQTQWLPLYLLALWRCLDIASPLAIGLLAAATAGVTLSNFYGGLIAAVMTPVAVASYWLVDARRAPCQRRRLAITVASLVVVAVCGAVYAWYAAGPVLANRAAFSFPRTDLFRYSAKWWGYLVPPVAHPLLGGAAARIWSAAQVREGLLEQQVSLGWGVVLLGLLAVFYWFRGRGAVRQPASLVRVPVLVAVAVTALFCSLSPERTIGPFHFVRPSALLYEALPMFRSYARFGAVVQLMAVLLAAIGVDCLRRTGTLPARVVGGVLLGAVTAEYAVAPSAMWRDVLPTAAHRWITQQPGAVRALDCTAQDQESASVPWLTENRVRLLGGATPDCDEPGLPEKLAATGYTHVIARAGTEPGRWLPDRRIPDGLRVAAGFDNAVVFAVAAAIPVVYTGTIAGCSPREHEAGRSWQWMGSGSEWTIVNTTGTPVTALLDVEISAFHHARRLEVRLDGRPLHSLVVDPLRREYRLGPMPVAPGEHALEFRASAPPTAANDAVKNGDPRPLSFAFGSWRWSVPGDRP